MKEAMLKMDGSMVQGDCAPVQASMSQVEMTVWLCVMALMASGMLALLALVSARVTGKGARR